MIYNKKLKKNNIYILIRNNMPEEIDYYNIYKKYYYYD